MWRINDVITRETEKKGMGQVNLQMATDFTKTNKFGPPLIGAPSKVHNGLDIGLDADI